MKFAIALLILGSVLYVQANQGAIPMMADGRSEQAKNAFKSKIQAYVAELNVFSDNIDKLKETTKSLLDRAIETLERSERDANDITNEFRDVSNAALETINQGIDNAKDHMIQMMWTGVSI